MFQNRGDEHTWVSVGVICDGKVLWWVGYLPLEDKNKSVKKDQFPGKRKIEYRGDITQNKIK